MILTRRASVRGLAAFSIRVDPAVKEALEKLAYEKRQSLGMTVGQILESAVADMVEETQDQAG